MIIKVKMPNGQHPTLLEVAVDGDDGDLYIESCWAMDGTEIWDWLSEESPEAILMASIEEIVSRRYDCAVETWEEER